MNTLITRNRLRNWLAIAASLWFSACATFVFSPVPDAEKAVSGLYDGVWKATVSGSAGLQSAGGRSFNCPAMDNYVVRFKVKEGSTRAELGYGSDRQKFNIGETGALYVRANGSGAWKQRGGVLQKPQTVVVLKGSLKESEGSGQYVISMRELNGAGCSYRTKFEKVQG